MLSMCQPWVPRVIPETCLVIVSCHSCPKQGLFFPKVLLTLREPLAQHGEIERNICCLIARQLAAETLRLHCKVHSCADVFAVEKSHDRQRVILNGSSISEAAATAPCESVKFLGDTARTR